LDPRAIQRASGRSEQGGKDPSAAKDGMNQRGYLGLTGIRHKENQDSGQGVPLIGQEETVHGRMGIQAVGEKEPVAEGLNTAAVLLQNADFLLLLRGKYVGLH